MREKQKLRVKSDKMEDGWKGGVKEKIVRNITFVMPTPV
jgi:hypothetical protein